MARPLSSEKGSRGGAEPRKEGRDVVDDAEVGQDLSGVERREVFHPDFSWATTPSTNKSALPPFSPRVSAPPREFFTPSKDCSWLGPSHPGKVHAEARSRGKGGGDVVVDDAEVGQDLSGVERHEVLHRDFSWATRPSPNKSTPLPLLSPRLRVSA